MSRWKTNNWQDGDVVTLEALGHVITGRVVVQGRAVRVAYTDLAGRAREEWPDGWAIGSGALQDTCVECGNVFRTDDKHEPCCSPCLRREAGRSSAGFGHRHFRKVG